MNKIIGQAKRVQSSSLNSLYCLQLEPVLTCRYMKETVIKLKLDNARKYSIIHVWAAPLKNVSSGICGQRRPRTACASAQSDQDIRCPLAESVNTIECINGEQMPR